MGFGVWGLGFGVWVLGFGAWGLGFGVWGLGFRNGIWDSGSGAQAMPLSGEESLSLSVTTCFRDRETFVTSHLFLSILFVTDRNREVEGSGGVVGNQLSRNASLSFSLSPSLCQQGPTRVRTGSGTGPPQGDRAPRVSSISGKPSLSSCN